MQTWPLMENRKISFSSRALIVNLYFQIFYQFDGKNYIMGRSENKIQTANDDCNCNSDAGKSPLTTPTEKKINQDNCLQNLHGSPKKSNVQVYPTQSNFPAQAFQANHSGHSVNNASPIPSTKTSHHNSQHHVVSLTSTT